MDKASLVELRTAPQDTPDVIERRRPGRVEHENPSLIALLRQSSSRIVEDAALEPAGHDLISARGILIGLLFSAPVWGVVGVTIWFLIG
jgi:hypothetical protein